MVRRWLAFAIIALGLIALRGRCRDDRPPLRFATWNIEDFPKGPQQIARAFEEIATLDASFIAVQEITEPDVFAREAGRRLGDDWAFATGDTRPYAQLEHHLGVLFDRRRWTLLSITTHDDTRAGRQKPALEVRLAPTGGGDPLRIIVVHFKSGGEAEAIRARQLEGLQALLQRVRASGERVVVLGDFNATGEPDRRRIAAVAAATSMTWATEGLACSAFWRRAEDCPRSRLDHILMWEAPRSVTAKGECERSGCDDSDRCPLYARDVSDHCPVVITAE